ncbi:MAG: LysM peptidoglycan-binding domain-containing protein [Chloroflexota bacterium]|nr:LysM peptidoglycan-binding domain-containing protein [Chloroflexota bacterium]
MLEVAPVLSMVPTVQSLSVSNALRADVLAPPIASAPSVADPAPTQTASPTAQRSPIAASTPTPMTYVVASGDTLAKIAARFGVTVSALAAANNIQDPGKIRTGMVLTIPAAPK